LLSINGERRAFAALAGFLGLASLTFRGIIRSRCLGSVGLDGGLALFAFEAVIFVAEALVLVAQGTVLLLDLFDEVEQETNGLAGVLISNGTEIKRIKQSGSGVGR
jgi:hypothetical protein